MIKPFLTITAKEVDAEESEEHHFDFSSPEDVLIYVDHNAVSNHNADWDGWDITLCQVIYGKAGITGAASYEQTYGGFLDHVIMDIIDCPKERNYYVVVGMTGYYYKGDGYSADDDMDFYYESVRLATVEELKTFL